MSINATQIFVCLLLAGAAIYLANTRFKQSASIYSPTGVWHQDNSRLSTQDRDAETVINRIQETLSLLKRKYPIADSWSGDQGKFTVGGIDDVFYLTVSTGQCILSTDSWHEHFEWQSGVLYGLDGAYSLEEFLDGLFSGTIQILVEYRGETPVGQQVLVLRGEEVIPTHHTILLLLFSGGRNLSES